MNMSPACTPPVQPTVTATERAHPRYTDYARYRSAMCRQLVSGLSFAAWLAAREHFERGCEVVFHTLPGATLTPGWYKHTFAPGSRNPARKGPFHSKAEAEQS
jgi:hypothetical protein